MLVGCLVVVVAFAAGFHGVDRQAAGGTARGAAVLDEAAPVAGVVVAGRLRTAIDEGLLDHRPSKAGPHLPVLPGLAGIAPTLLAAWWLRRPDRTVAGCGRPPRSPAGQRAPPATSPMFA